MAGLRLSVPVIVLAYAVACGGTMSPTAPAVPDGGASAVDASVAADGATTTEDAASPTLGSGVDASAQAIDDGGIDAATFPDATFVCDFQACDIYTEFCGVIPVGMSGPICYPLPAPCLADRTCACVHDAGLSVAFGSCIVGDAGEIIFPP